MPSTPKLYPELSDQRKMTRRCVLRSMLTNKVTGCQRRCPVSNRSFALLSSLATIATLTILALAAPPMRAADNTRYSYARIVRLSYVRGDVQIVRTDKSNKWEPAVLNMPVEQGFAIGTNNGRAEIELEHGSTIWLAENSVLQFTELALANGGRITRLALSQGTATFDASLSAGDTLELATPSFRAVPANKCEFRVDMFSEGGAVSVLNGKVSVSSAAGTQDVPKGQTFATNSKATKTALKRSPSPDEWDHWVANRSTAQASGQNQASLYTNAPFTYGMADLAGYGSWNYFPGLGYGWQPWGVSAGWAPFTAGQWSFYPSLGWTWLSSEPWGWVPYHFGGWQYSSMFGWMWMPGDYGAWTAAPVEWVGVGNQIGWVPRAVNAPLSGATRSPVIVSTKALGKGGKNRVFGASEVSARMQTFAFPPAANGKPGTAADQMSVRFTVPTAANLITFGAGSAANSAAKVDVNALHVAASSGVPGREFTLVNAAIVAPKMPSPPPARAAFTSDGTPSFSSAGSLPTMNRTSQQSTNTSTQAAHSSSTASGKPH
jgi:FecR protein